VVTPGHHIRSYVPINTATPGRGRDKEPDVTITPQTLTRGTAAAAVAAGVTFIGVQIGHPHLDADAITTTEMAIRGSGKVLMAVLALAGITGMYVSSVRRNGILGLVGYLVFAAGYLCIMATSFVAAYVLPSVVDDSRDYVTGVLDVSKGGSTGTDVGALDVIFQLQGLGYLAGGLLFGIALFRAGVLTRWACALLAVSGPVSAALAVMPDAFYRLLAFPNAIAMIGLGYSLWTTTRTSTDPATTVAAAGQRPVTAGAE
jgi:hypothetical protein